MKSSPVLSQMSEGEEREREDGVGEKKRVMEGKKLCSLCEENKQTQFCVCCSHFTKWSELGRCTEATAG